MAPKPHGNADDFCEVRTVAEDIGFFVSAAKKKEEISCYDPSHGYCSWVWWLFTRVRLSGLLGTVLLAPKLLGVTVLEGAIPLSLGLPWGELVLAVAVLAILLTTPFGAIAMDKLYPVLLERAEGG